jgi:hypothetical protein
MMERIKTTKDRCFIALLLSRLCPTIIRVRKSAAVHDLHASMASWRLIISTMTIDRPRAGDPNAD